MEERFLAVNRQAHTLMIGLWDGLCDLDKRIWDVRPFDADAEEKEPEPLAIIEVDDNPNYRYKEIYSHHDLVGVYLG